MTASLMLGCRQWNMSGRGVSRGLKCMVWLSSCASPVCQEEGKLHVVSGPRCMRDLWSRPKSGPQPQLELSQTVGTLTGRRINRFGATDCFVTRHYFVVLVISCYTTSL